MKLIEHKPTTKQLVKFSIISLIYILWIIWMRSYWMLIGLAIIFDIYISKKVKWNIFKQKKGEKKKKWKEWADAIIFALVVSSIIKIFIFQLYAIPTGSLEKTLLIGDRLFVSKLSYGPKMPMTPISFPLVHNTLPLAKNKDSFLDWISWDYKRLAGLSEIERDDIVVFNFPVGDTICVGSENPDYYAHLRMNGRKFVEANYEIKTRPLDKKENFVKRCVALPGDSLTIVDTKVRINGKPQKAYKGIEFSYLVETDGQNLNPKARERLGLSSQDVQSAGGARYLMTLTNDISAKLKTFPMVKSINKMVKPKGERDENIFPHDSTFKWNQDNFGPLWIPKQGETIDLTPENIILYRRVIDVYEYNDYQEKDGKVYIDGKQVDKYTFKQNYYWMMGDNRHNSADSRAWGFVPEDHIVGTPVLIFYSLDEEKSFPSSIRWDRIFKVVRKE